jgi:hypothetical protein
MSGAPATPVRRPQSWEAALDALEARLALQEAALAANRVDASFEALPLPVTPPGPGDPIRAELALRRVHRLAEQLRTLQDQRTAPVRTSPYG